MSAPDSGWRERQVSVMLERPYARTVLHSLFPCVWRSARLLGVESCGRTRRKHQASSPCAGSGRCGCVRFLDVLGRIPASRRMPASRRSHLQRLLVEAGAPAASGSLLPQSGPVGLQCAFGSELRLVLAPFGNTGPFLEPLRNRSRRASKRPRDFRFRAEVLEKVICCHARIIGVPKYEVKQRNQIISALRLA